VLRGGRVCSHCQVLETLLLKLFVQCLVVVVEVLRKAMRWEIFDLGVEHTRDWEPVLLEDVEKEDQFVLTLLPVIDFLLKFH